MRNLIKELNKGQGQQAGPRNLIQAMGATEPQAVEPVPAPAPEEPSRPKEPFNLSRYLVEGVAEPAIEAGASLAAGMASYPVGLLSGAAALTARAFRGDKVKTPREAEEEIAGLVPHPKSELGQQTAAPIGKVFEYGLAPARKVGEVVTKSLGPEAGWLAEKGVELLTFKGAHMAGKGIKGRVDLLRKAPTGEAGAGKGLRASPGLRDTDIRGEAQPIRHTPLTHEQARQFEIERIMAEDAAAEQAARAAYERTPEWRQEYIAREMPEEPGYSRTLGPEAGVGRPATVETPLQARSLTDTELPRTYPVARRPETRPVGLMARGEAIPEAEIIPSGLLPYPEGRGEGFEMRDFPPDVLRREKIRGRMYYERPGREPAYTAGKSQEPEVYLKKGKMVARRPPTKQEMRADTERIRKKFIVRSEGVTSAAEKAIQNMEETNRADCVYRGITSNEYDNTIAMGGGAKSTRKYSFSKEGTSFAERFDDAESYINYGRDDPRKTGKPTYIIEVAKQDNLKINRQGYYEADQEIPVKQIKRIWKMQGEGKNIIAKEVTSTLKSDRLAKAAQRRQAFIDRQKLPEEKEAKIEKELPLGKRVIDEVKQPVDAAIAASAKGKIKIADIAAQRAKKNAEALKLADGPELEKLVDEQLGRLPEKKVVGGEGQRIAPTPKENMDLANLGIMDRVAELKKRFPELKAHDVLKLSRRIREEATGEIGEAPKGEKVGVPKEWEKKWGKREKEARIEGVEKPIEKPKQPTPEKPVEKAKGEKKPAYDYSSTQVNLPKGSAKKITDYSKKIPDAEIHTDPKDPTFGREEHPHITVKYGLHTSDAKKVEPVLRDVGPIKAKMGKVSVFKNDKYDVVNVEIESPELHALNKKIADALEHTDTHPEYKPHATIAYVKKGEGKKYEGDTAFEGTDITLNALEFSAKDGTSKIFRLSGKKAKPTVPRGTKPEAKQAWEMTREEFYKSKGFKKTPSKDEISHWYEVDSALRKNKPVPSSVLKDYPDLKPKKTKLQEREDLLQQREKPSATFFRHIREDREFRAKLGLPIAEGNLLLKAIKEGRLTPEDIKPLYEKAKDAKGKIDLAKLTKDEYMKLFAATGNKGWRTMMAKRYDIFVKPDLKPEAEKGLKEGEEPAKISPVTSKKGPGEIPTTKTPTSPKGGEGRAKAGGQIGVNGYFYKGGQFLPSTDLPPGTWRIDKKIVRASKEQIELKKWETQPTPYSRSIFTLIEAQIDWPHHRATGEMRPFKGAEETIRPGVRGKLGKEEYTLQELIDQYEKGARWIDVNPSPSRAPKQGAQPPATPTLEQFTAGLTHGLAFRKGKQVPFKEYREITRGKNKGKVQVTWPEGKKSIVEKADVARWPGKEEVPATPKPRPKTEAEVKAETGIPPDLPISVSPNDLSFERARRAHMGSSFVPEQRAKQRQQDYVNYIVRTYNKVKDLAKTEEQKAILKEELERYRQGLLAKYNAMLDADARTMSSMITGPSNFPTARNRKRLDTAHRRLEEFIEWERKAAAAIKKKIRPELGPISSDMPNAIELLEKKIADAEKHQETMKAINKIVRMRKLTDAEKVAKIQKDFSFKEATARAILEPDFGGRKGFPAYELQNNNANIRRMKERVADLKKREADTTTETKFEGGTIVDNVEENRLQILFDKKPDAELRKQLKSRGFRWAPSQGAWQRKRGASAEWAAKDILGVKPEVPTVTLESLGFQTIYEKAVEAVRKHKAKDAPLTRKESNRLKRDINLNAAKIWGKKDNAQYEAFKEKMFGRKVSARDLTDAQLQYLDKGLKKLAETTDMHVEGSKTKIVKHRIVRRAKRKTMRVAELKEGQEYNSSSGLTWKVISSDKDGVTVQNAKGTKKTWKNDQVITLAEREGADLMAPAMSEYESNAIRALPELRKRPLGGWTENPIRVFEEIGSPIKDLLYNKMRYAEVAAKKELVKLRHEFKKISGVGVFHGAFGKSQRRIGIYAIAQQKNGPAILKAMGIKKIPKLTAKEMKTYNWMREHLESLYTRLNEARIASGKEPFGKVDNYFTFFRVFSLQEKLGWDAHSPTAVKYFNKAYEQFIEKHFKTTPFRFAKQRKEARRAVRLDAYNVFDQYAESALQHIHKSPEIARGREYLLKFDDGFELKQVKPNTAAFLSQWLDAAAGQRVRQLPQLIENGLSKLNNNLTFAVLSANVRSALIQPTAFLNSVAEIGPRYASEGISGIFRPSIRKEIMDKSALITRQYDIAVREAMTGLAGKAGAVKKAVGTAALKPLSILDMETAMASWWGAYKKALKHDGMTEAKARVYADDVVTRTQASALEIDLAPIQRTAAGRTLSLFQTFVINNWNFLAKDVMGIKNPRVTKAQALKKAATWVAGAILVNVLYEDGLQLHSPLPTPVRSFQEAYEKGESSHEVALRVARELAEVVPIIGGAVRYGSNIAGPVAELGTDVVQKLADKKGPQRSWFDIGGRVVGIPGTRQIEKTRKRLEWGHELPEAILGSGGYQKAGRGRATRATRARRATR